MQIRQNSSLSLAASLWDTLKSIGLYTWNNKLKVFLIYLASTEASKENHKDNSLSSIMYQPNSFGPLTSYSYFYSSLDLKQQCPAVYDDHENFQDIQSIIADHIRQTEFEAQIFNRIQLEDSLASQLTPAQQLAHKNRVFYKIKKLYENDPEKRYKLSTLVESKNFKIVSVEDFKHQPGALGIFDSKINTLFIRNAAHVPCDDIVSIVGHEAHHGFIGNLIAQNDVTTYFERTGRKPTRPFTNDQERDQLDAALLKGDQFVINDFQKLHKKAQAGTLVKGSDEEKEYLRLVNVLRDYELI